MKREQTFWCPSPDEDANHDREWLLCRLADDWYATDGDRAILPITKLHRRGEDRAEVSGLLVQFGGSDLILDLVEAGISEGDEFTVINPANGRPYVDEAAAIPDPDDGTDAT